MKQENPLWWDMILWKGPKLIKEVTVTVENLSVLLAAESKLQCKRSELMSKSKHTDKYLLWHFPHNSEFYSPFNSKFRICIFFVWLSRDYTSRYADTWLAPFLLFRLRILHTTGNSNVYNQNILRFYTCSSITALVHFLYAKPFLICISSMKSSDRTKQSVCGWQYIYIYIYIYISVVTSE